MSLIYRDMRASGTLVFGAITEAGQAAGAFTGTLQLGALLAGGSLSSAPSSGAFTGTLQLADLVAGGALQSVGSSGAFTGTLQLADLVASGMLVGDNEVPTPLCADRMLVVDPDVERPLIYNGYGPGWFKDVDETLDYGADFTLVMDQLPDDEIVGHVVSANYGLTVVSSARRGMVVAALVSGGVPGYVATLSCRIITAQRRVIEAPLYISVISR